MVGHAAKLSLSIEFITIKLMIIEIINIIVTLLQGSNYHDIAVKY